MAAPDVTLTAGKILAEQTTSGLGIEVQTPGYIFGVTVAVYDGSDGAQTNQSVLFKEADAVVLKYGSTIYYLMDVENIAFTEVIPV